jgi:hypothetical protein
VAKKKNSIINQSEEQKEKALNTNRALQTYDIMQTNAHGTRVPEA